jgi:hypothetical protein
MRIMQAAAALATAIIVLAEPAAAQSRHIYTLWMIEPAPAPSGVRHLASKEYVLKQRLLPTRLAELPRQVGEAEIGSSLPAGTQLIEVSNRAGALFCEGEMHKGKLAGGRAQICFMDADRDGRFESRFKSWSATPSLVTISGRIPKTLTPIASPIEYRLVDPATSRLGAFVAIERRNYFNIYSRESFMIVFGAGERQSRITTPVSFKSAEMPKEMTILGARFTALSEAEGKMAIEVHSPMPRQPFGVIQTVSYR